MIVEGLTVLGGILALDVTQAIVRRGKARTPRPVPLPPSAPASTITMDVSATEIRVQCGCGAGIVHALPRVTPPKSAGPLLHVLRVKLLPILQEQIAQRCKLSPRQLAEVQQCITDFDQSFSNIADRLL
jgi:hypothetical protein